MDTSVKCKNNFAFYTLPNLHFHILYQALSHSMHATRSHIVRLLSLRSSAVMHQQAPDAGRWLRLPLPQPSGLGQWCHVYVILYSLLLIFTMKHYSSLLQQPSNPPCMGRYMQSAGPKTAVCCSRFPWGSSRFHSREIRGTQETGARD